MTKLLILAAGFGSRMGSMGEHFSKALLPMQGKAIISHIIENTISDEVVIAVGYKSSQIKEYCSVFHNDKNIKFVDVDNFDGPGSGPGYSMKCCRHELDCPFYIVTADSLLTAVLPPIDSNWIGIGKVDDIKHYSTCDTDENGNVIDFRNKSQNPLPFAFTGVVAVLDYTLFWQKFDNYLKESSEKEIEFVGALYKPFFANIKAKEIDWKDVGRRDIYIDLYETTEGVDDYDLKKTDHDEITYVYKNKVAKLSSPKIILNKRKRQKTLSDYTPALQHSNLENMIVHDFVDGKNLYQIADRNVYFKFLDWLKSGLFTKRIDKQLDFQRICHKFYKEKTYQRVSSFLNRFKGFDCNLVISNASCKNVYYYLDKIDWDFICKESIPYIFHGDLNFGNVIQMPDGNFKLIDWRSDFSGLEFGDLYYDFAKLYACCLINFYKCCHEKNYFYKNDESNYDINFICTSEEKIFLLYFKQWLEENNYCLKKIELVACLIFLNMAPLHLEDFSKYLYFQGIRHLELYFRENTY